MKDHLVLIAAHILRWTRLQYWPVRVRSGIARGARWTLFPWTSYWRGSTQEPAMHQVLVGLGDVTGWSCWDLGAHFGIYGVGLARRVGPTGEVACFEPNPRSFSRLVRHAKMNGLDWLKAFNLAVSNQTATGQLYTYGSLDTTTTHLRYDEEPVSAAAKPLEIKTAALDDLVASKQIRLPNLIKVDVEGHGHKALAGAAQSIRASRPIIIMGFHSTHEVEGTKAVLDPLGYTWEALEPNAPADWVWADVILRPPATGTKS
jgi:FkbM family methyltransferase